MSENDHLLPDVTTTYERKSNNCNYKLTEPRDQSRLIYASFCVIGIGMLLPWNFFINADQYFKDKLENDNNDKKLFESAFSICSQVPCGIALILNLYLTDRVSRKGRVYTTLVISALFFILTTILVNVNTKTWTSKFFGVTLASIVVINFCSGIFQGTIFGIAGALGGRYVQGAAVGMSVAGTFASVANLVALAAGNDILISATIYFSIATTVIVLCGIVFMVLTKTEMFQQRFLCKNEESVISTSSSSSSNVDSSRNVAVVLKLIYPVALSVMFNFMITLIVMPSILSGIHSVDASNSSLWTNKYFTGVSAFLIFNLGDFIGRIISGFIRLVDKKGPWLPVLCIIRVVFIPLFMFCNYQPRQHLAVAFNSDVYPIVFNILFGVSNGYCASLCMMYGPELVPGEMMETAGATMQLFLTIGLGLGAAFSFLFVGII